MVSFPPNARCTILLISGSVRGGSVNIVPGACAAVPVPRSAIGGDGVILDEAIRSVIARVLTALVARVAERRRDAGLRS